jgi:hypothetical protein
LRVIAGKLVFLLPRRLRSPNLRSSWRAAHGDREAWLKLIDQAEAGVRSDMTWKEVQEIYGSHLPVITRMRMDILRLAPNQRYMMDHDNLHASVKRLQDALKNKGYLVDDNPRWLDSHIVQGISDDKKYWTIVTLSRAEDANVYAFPVVSAKDEAERRLRASDVRHWRRLGRGVSERRANPRRASGASHGNPRTARR